MRLSLNLCAILCILHFSQVSCYRLKGSQRSPIILVPGDGGSQVDARLNKTTAVHYICQKKTSDYFNIWLNLELLVPVVIDCWIDNIKLIYDNVTRKTRNQDGVDIRIPGWGDPFVVEYLDPSKASPGVYFKDIGNMLVNELGYVRKQSLRGAPYDFRKGPNESEEFFKKLKDLIEETYTMNNNVSVTLITHSMGGPMSLIFLQSQSQNWKNKYIQSLITLAAPWGGSVKALKVFAVGDNLGAYFLSGSVLRDEQITSPSLSWLLPSKIFWKETEILVQTSERNYTLKDLQQFFLDIEVPNGWEFYKDNEKYQLDFTPPGVEIHCLYGSNIDTVERLYYKPGTTITDKPELVPGDGDGTVNLRSLEGCLHWQGKMKKKVYYKKLSKVDHSGILSSVEAIAYIKKVMAV